ncbi:glycosyltransferase family 2 protein [Clostridium disporicum]|uniref:Glycosyl transferase family protein n=1 Tax=Clostridium disporicum TaxID=84024 RepID=A0A174L560_9CLOT|nr:glycosyltransferase family 2 protein [Clostridium disporicum]CUP17288.1 glycosyl transferase family protein [Clostridium disporicum]
MISVIIPVYNSEKYICNTIDSVIKQTYTNIEIILIDDGSTDSSLDLCRKFEREDNRIRVFNKINGGVSSARNLGVNKANGDYLFFLDSDDILIPNCLEILKREINNNPDSVIISDYKKFYYDEEISIQSLGYDIKTLTIEEFYKQILLLNYDTYPWGTLIKASYFENITFPEHMTCFEDLATMYKVYDKAKKIILINAKLVLYRQSEFSAVKTINIDKIKNYVEATNNFCDYVLEKYPDLSDYQCVFKSYVCLAILQMNNINKSAEIKKNCIRYLESNIKKASKYVVNKRQLIKFTLYKNFKFIFWTFIKIINLKKKFSI